MAGKELKKYDDTPLRFSVTKLGGHLVDSDAARNAAKEIALSAELEEKAKQVIQHFTLLIGQVMRAEKAKVDQVTVKEGTNPLEKFSGKAIAYALGVIKANYITTKRYHKAVTPPSTIQLSLKEIAQTSFNRASETQEKLELLHEDYLAEVHTAPKKEEVEGYTSLADLNEEQLLREQLFVDLLRAILAHMEQDPSEIVRQQIW